MSCRSNLIACALVLSIHVEMGVPAAIAQPQFWFDPLPELPGGASESFSDIVIVDRGGFTFSAGRALDGDGIWKAVVWTKEAGQPWEIQTLPNPFGNTESSAMIGEIRDLAPTERIFSVGGYAQDSESNPQPVVWTSLDDGPWTPEVLPLPPGFDSGAAVGNDDAQEFPSMSLCGWVDQSDDLAPRHAALWKKDGNGVWTVELLPDNGPGFASEAREIGQSEPDPLSLKSIGGYVQTESSPQVPCVWDEQPGGVFERIDLPMLPGAYLGSVEQIGLPSDPPGLIPFSAVGHNASIAGLADLYRGVLYRRENGVWGAPLELPPLPGLRDSRATGVSFLHIEAPVVQDGLPLVVGHSYVELTPGSERATLWEVAPDDTIITYDLNERTVNLPPNVVLSTRPVVGNVDADPEPEAFTGNHFNADSLTTPHAHVLILLNETDCNKNGEDDALDLYNGTSPDANGNGVPDECEPRFSFEALPEPPGASGSESYALFWDGGSRTIWVSGRTLDANGIWKAVLWRQEAAGPWTIEVLPNPFGNTESSALFVTTVDLAAPGEEIISGYAHDGNGNSQPMVWTGDGAGPGSAEVLPLLAGSVGGAVSFVVTDTLPSPQLSVGHINLQDGTTDAALWTRNKATQTWTITPLPDFGPGLGSQAHGAAIHPESGLMTIVGQVENDAGQLVPAIWEGLGAGDIALVEPPLLPGGTSGISFRVYYREPVPSALSVGDSSTAHGTTHAVLWQNNAGVWEAPTDLGTLPGYSNSNARDSAGSSPGTSVVGHSDNGPGTERATLWQNAEDPSQSFAFDLNDLTVDLPPGISLSNASSIAGCISIPAICTDTFSIAGTFTQPPPPPARGGFGPHAYVLTSVLGPGPEADPSGLNKARFVSFSVPASATASAAETAIRVRLISLHHVEPPYTGGPSVPFTSFEGQSRWVGAPTQYVESSASGIPFYASRLQCTPHYQDWSTVGLLHVTGSAITPSSMYEVENLAASCASHEAMCAAVSAALSISTTRWGDVRNPYNPPDPSVQPDISDVSALVDKFRSAPGAPIKARAILAGEPGNSFGEITPAVLGVDFGFSHISACVDAFRGVPYPYTISSCP